MHVVPKGICQSHYFAAMLGARIPAVPKFKERRMEEMNDYQREQEQARRDKHRLLSEVAMLHKTNKVICCIIARL